MNSSLLRVAPVRGAWLLGVAFVLSAAGTAQAHDGGLGNAVMWQACQGRGINDPCAFQSLDHDVFRGSCQSMSNAMVCVRNQPIEHAANGTHSHATGVVADATPYATPRATPPATPASAGGWPWLAGGLVLLARALGVGLNTRRGC